MAGETIYSADQVLSQVLDDALNALKIEAAATLAVAQGHKNEDSVIGSASVAAGAAFVTVVSFTPVTEKIITFYNADVQAILSINFRVRLRVNGVVKSSEALSSIEMGMVPIFLKCPANQAIDVQIVHSDVAAQTFEGSINYRDV